MNDNGKTQRTAGSAPPETTVYAVGDIHGQLDLLESLMARIRDDASRRRTGNTILVFVGDYIDRGPHSAAVIEFLVRKLPEDFQVHYLIGNHEHAMLAFFENPAVLPHWLVNGAAETFLSYGIDPPQDYAGEDEFRRCRDALVSAIPNSHRKFLDDLELYVELGGYLFVHAGIRPGVRLEEQSMHDLLWIREGFLDCDDDLGRVVVHGHTPGLEPVVRRNRIGIDTGAWVHGCLTAVRLEGAAWEFLQVREPGA